MGRCWKVFVRRPTRHLTIRATERSIILGGPAFGGVRLTAAWGSMHAIKRRGQRELPLTWVDEEIAACLRCQANGRMCFFRRLRISRTSRAYRRRDAPSSRPRHSVQSRSQSPNLETKRRVSLPVAGPSVSERLDLTDAERSRPATRLDTAARKPQSCQPAQCPVALQYVASLGFSVLRLCRQSRERLSGDQRGGG